MRQRRRAATKTAMCLSLLPSPRADCGPASDRRVSGVRCDVAPQINASRCAVVKRIKSASPSTRQRAAVATERANKRLETAVEHRGQAAIGPSTCTVGANRDSVHRRPRCSHTLRSPTAAAAADVGLRASPTIQAPRRLTGPVGGDLEDAGVGLAYAGLLGDHPVGDVLIEAGHADLGLLLPGRAVGHDHRDPAGVAGDLKSAGDQRVQPVRPTTAAASPRRCPRPARSARSGA